MQTNANGRLHNGRNVGAGSFGDVALREAINDGDIPGLACWSLVHPLELQVDTAQITTFCHLNMTFRVKA